jgi:transcriptional regulator with XRE-family HTH domain
MESIHAYVVRELELAKGRWSEVAEGTGISKRTIEKIASGETANPGVSHVEKLASYFRNGRTSQPESRAS